MPNRRRRRAKAAPRRSSGRAGLRAARPRRAAGARKRESAAPAGPVLSFLIRYRATFVAAPFCVMLIGAVLWMSGLRLAETLFSSDPSARAAERLLLAIERDSAHTPPRGLVNHLPANLVPPDDIRRAIASPRMPSASIKDI